MDKLVDHVLHEMHTNASDKHAKIPFLPNGEINPLFFVNIYWYKQNAHDDLETNLRQRIFKATTFGVTDPEPLDMITTTTTVNNNCG